MRSEIVKKAVLAKENKLLPIGVVSSIFYYY